jgi:tripartite-type tricarboxylate transporter receptor subunit TctC
MIRLFRQTILVAAVGVIVSGAPALAEEGVSFQGKTITMIIPTTAGAGTDMNARLFARFFSKHLPGSPTFVSQNMPAGHGVTALNYMVQQVKPDGTTVSMSSSSQLDPITYRMPQAKYDPAMFAIIGSIGSGDTVMIMRTDAQPRLLDKSKPPVTMGSVPGIPRTSQRMAVWGTEYLGWNTKWVVGYPGSSDLGLAMERGEIDMTAFPKPWLIDKLTDTAKYKVLYTDAASDEVRKPTGRADLDNAPSFIDAMAGKIKDPLMNEAFEYWRAGILIKWLALPPKTPDAVRDTYRAAFKKTVADPEFIAIADQSMPGYTVLSAEATEKIIHNLAKTSQAAMDAIDDLMRKQGLKVPKKETH